MSPIATSSGRLAPQTSTTGNSVYNVWPNNDTGAGNVFVARNSDDDKTVSKTIVLCTQNKEHVIDHNIPIAASVYVYVTWWTNESGVLELVSRVMVEIYFAQNGEAEWH